MNYLVGFILMILGCCCYGQQPKFVIDGAAQGTSYHIVYYADQVQVPKSAIDSLLREIDLSMSLYNAQSLISEFNRPEVSHIVMDSHMQHVIKASFALNKQSHGIFDITVKPLVSLWGFGPERIRKAPSAADIAAVLPSVGMKKLKRKGSALTKKNANLSIDLNGIAQGYSVDYLAAFLSAQGLTQFLVELGGEIYTQGLKPDGTLFQIAIERPPSVMTEKHEYILQLKDKAVTTSGSYRKYSQHEGRHIHHHMDPKTGYPVQSQMMSATVICSSAMMADGYDNVFMALPLEEALTLANRLKDVEVYLIYRDGDQIKEAFSTNFKHYIKTN